MNLHRDVIISLLTLFRNALLPTLLLAANAGFARESSQFKVAQEEKVRAAIVVGIVRYTKWEDGTNDTINICLLGNTDSFTHLQALQNTRLIHNKALNISHLTSEEEAANSNCQVLVVGPQNLMDINKLKIAKSCLVICDGCSNQKENASVILRKEKNRIRFDVYLNRAREHRVKFSAAMLELAAHVEGLRD